MKRLLLLLSLLAGTFALYGAQAPAPAGLSAKVQDLIGKALRAAGMTR